MSTEIPTPASNPPSEKCPRCGSHPIKGFAAKATLVSFIDPAKFQRTVFVDEDLTHSSLIQKLLPSKAEFYRSYLCQECHLYTIDLAATLDREEANLAAQMIVSEQ